MPRSDHLFARVAAVASRQHAHFTHDDARRLDVADATLAEWVHRGLVERVAPHVYRIAGAPVTWIGDAMLGAQWTGGLVSHGAGLALRSLDGSRRTRPIDVLLPLWGRTHHKVDVVHVHETRDLKGVDMDQFNGVPTTSLVRTLLDACATIHPFQVGLALDHACRRDSTLLARLHRRYLELKKPGRNGMRVAGRLIYERMGGKGFSHQGFEANAKRLVRDIGLPEPHKNFAVRDDRDGFKASIDLAWPPIKWGIECQSIERHLNKRAHEYDKVRRRRLKLLGWELEEVTYDQVTIDKLATGRDLLELYHLRCAEIASK